MRKGMVIHHTGFVCSKISEAEQIKIAGKIFQDKYTYHYIFTRCGTILQGHDLTEIVGHAANQKLPGDIDIINREYIGIAMMGNFKEESWTLSQLFCISYIYQSLTKTRKLGNEIKLHSEISYTECPGSLTKQIISPFLKMDYRELLPYTTKECIQQGGTVYIQARLPEKLGLVSTTLWQANEKKIIYFR